jgi:hypothetical protein
MSQRHLYGTNYIELTPPAEWEAITVDATINDSTFEATINTLTFTFVGDTSTFISNWITQYGVFNGVPYRIEIFEDNTTTIIFDGFIVLSEMEINSITGPNIISAPVRSLNDNVSVIDKVSVLTQGLLYKQQWIQNSDFVDVPVVVVSKKNIQDRTIAITSLTYTIVSTFFQAIQNFFSAISDVLGTSVVVGLIELASFFFNLIITINQLVDLIVQHKDLLLASQTYYKGIGIKTVVEAAFSKYGYTVDWGIIDTRIGNEYLRGSSYGNQFSAITPGAPGIGILNPKDFGYQIGEMMQGVELKFNTRTWVNGNVVHIKSKIDPFWTQSPLYQPNNELVESTQQYTNGSYTNKTEEVYATTLITYAYDESDAWTLTEKTGDAYEIHRDLITELNPKMNTMKGLQDIAIPWAMCVRYDPIESLIQLMADSFGQYDEWMTNIKLVLNNYATYIDPNSGAGPDVSTFKDNPLLNFFFTLQSGGIKVEDDTWSIPKSIYAENVDGVLNVPSNFKDYIGAFPIYNDFYKPLSPAIQSEFKGQYKLIKGYTIRFSLTNYLQTKTNPYFLLNLNNAKFTHISFNESKRNAQTEIEYQEPFDTNITESAV